jgi:uncharacterized ferredoxin-like protein
MVNYDKMTEEALFEIAGFMAVAARTAPKTRGRDNLEIIVLDDGKERASIIKRMKEIARRDSRPSCERDAESVKDTSYILLIGTKSDTLGLNCGYCGYPNCGELSGTPGVCAYNAMDLGIALGSAAAVASRFHVDNRLMYSLGKAAIEEGLFKADIKQAIGIPLSATGKNPFFDRK